MDLNKIFVLGRVTADPVLKTTPGGQSVCTIGVATNRTWTDKAGAKQEEAEFHNVVCWGRTAEVAAQYLVKGATTLIEGRVRTREWTDKQGQKRRTTEIVCERLQLGPKPFVQGAHGGSPAAQSAKAKAARPEGAPALEDEIPTINLEDEEIKPEDIPF